MQNVPYAHNKDIPHESIISLLTRHQHSSEPVTLAHLNCLAHLPSPTLRHNLALVSRPVMSALENSHRISYADVLIVSNPTDLEAAEFVNKWHPIAVRSAAVEGLDRHLTLVLLAQCCEDWRKAKALLEVKEVMTP